MEITNKSRLASRALMVGTALISLNALTAEQAKAATGTGAMSASILTPITVSGIQTLHFGSLTVTAAAGTASVDTAGTRTVSGGVTGVGAFVPTNGVIQIQAGTGLSIQMSIGAGATVSNGAVTMTLSAFDINGDGNTSTFTLAAATETRPLGATLNVNGAQATGLYTGNYDITANYQ